MSSETAIKVKNITKKYHIYEKPLDRLKQILFRGKRNFYREFTALDNVSFEVSKGETVGIIGRNGSGKSTLLQIITQTLSPTSGSLEVNGRISALLELGSGFNPEFTGRENVLLNGAIMGFDEKEMTSRMEEIERFADIGDFIDQPVKLYSSGMFVRLAFACAINVDPDILIVDEALAVGDMQYQLKCIEKMKDFKKQGKTILFVSHDTYSIRNFCDHAIWLMDGKIYLRGNVNHVTSEYEDYMKTVSDVPKIDQTENQLNILSIDGVQFRNNAGEYTNEFQFGEDIHIEVHYTLYQPYEGIVGGVHIFDREHRSVCALNTKMDKYRLPSKAGKYKLVISYSNVNLLSGSYFIDVGFFEASGVVRLDYRAKLSSFRVYSDIYDAEGLIKIQHQWRVESGG